MLTSGIGLQPVPLVTGCDRPHACGMRLDQSYREPVTGSLPAVWPPMLLAGSAALIGWFSPWLWLSFLAVVGVLVMLLDTLARHRQYAHMRLALRQAGGLTGHALARFRKARTAWCTRRAVMAAACIEGFERESRQLVRDWGYRPWHVFPDGAFSQRSPFIRLGFWKSVLGLSRS
jgi:hypothetical protein